MEDEWTESSDEGSVHIDIPDKYGSLVTEHKRLTVRDLWSRYLSGELVLEPDFQRHYVWDSERASRYIESILLGLPVPPVFLAESLDGSTDVIDGHQRLETLFRFMSPLLSGPSGERSREVQVRFPASLTLGGLEVLGALEGRDVRALDPSDRAKIWEREKDVIWVRKESHPDMKFVLFARLNLGSMALNAQELRNCLYRGPYNKLIAELSEDPDVLRLNGRKNADKRMRDREKVLRFFALAHRRENYRSPFRSFLNDEMAANQHASAEDLAEFEAEFRHALTWTSRAFPGNEFRIFRVGGADDPNGYWDRRMDLVYDTETVGFHEFRGRLDETWAKLRSDEEKEHFLLGMRRRLVGVMVDEGFMETLKEGTLKPTTVRKRLERWSSSLQLAVDTWEDTVREGERVVSLQRISTACSLCPRHVESAEDAQVLRGSERDTLAHRYCARARVSHSRQEAALSA